MIQRAMTTAGASVGTNLRVAYGCGRIEPQVQAYG
jgi:hypothetical protein